MSPPLRGSGECEIVQQELHALLLDGQPPVREPAGLWHHLAGCAPCTRALAADAALHRAVKRLRGAMRAPDALRDRLERERGVLRRRKGDGSHPT